MADSRELMAVFVGGAIGAGLRTGVVELFPAAPGAWPWATFAANVTGAFVLGCLVTSLDGRSARWRPAHPFLGTGLCGALTTFATLQLELLGMLEGDHPARAAAYVIASVAAGIAAVALATAFVRRAHAVA